MDRLIIGDFNALLFSVFGIAIVFFGLSLIVLYIKLLPKFFKLIEFRPHRKRHEKQVPTEQEIEEEELAAIMVAFRLHNMSGFDEQKVTWQRHQGPKSTWDISRRSENFRGGK